MSFIAVDDTHKAVFMDDRDVAGSENLFSGFLARPVTFHHLRRSLGAQFATLTKQQVVAGGVDDLAQGRWHRDADGADLDAMERLN